LLKYRGGEPEIADGDQEPYKGHDHCEHPVIGRGEQPREEHQAQELEEEVDTAGGEIENAGTLRTLFQSIGRRLKQGMHAVLHNSRVKLTRCTFNDNLSEPNAYRSCGGGVLLLLRLNTGLPRDIIGNTAGII
jgi:hypothetical protein